jgi:Holliday junction DNA helicase RuvA
LAILSTLGFQGTVNALTAQNPKMLSQTPGIGIKKAEMMIIELKNKLENLLVIQSNSNEENNKLNEVMDVLKQLGYSPKDITFFNSYLLTNKHHLNKTTPEIIQVALTQAR